MKLRFDHAVYAVPDLAAASAFFREEWGLHVVMGGAHPNWGTHNSLCHFGLPYVEFIAVQDPDRARESDFGRNVLKGVEAGGGLVTAALATDDLDVAVALLRYNGVGVEGPFEGRRRRPDGSLLAWRMAWPEPYGGLPMPFLIQWQQDDDERTADLKESGQIAPHRMGALQFEGLDYFVRDVPGSVNAFCRYYGQESSSVGIRLAQGPPDIAEGPYAIRLHGTGGPTRRMAFGVPWELAAAGSGQR
ncbi:MAG TPA: VOC family protein [Symbiobacteriaceae bacterium]|nr:VOC family protein [Symbiobacteriaceae bacterium]